MIFDELKSAVDLYVQYKGYKKESEQQRKFNLTLINLYKLGNNGKNGVVEHALNNLYGLSKMDVFLSIKDAEMKGLIQDVSTFGGRQWILTPDGVLYVKALLEQIRK